MGAHGIAITSLSRKANAKPVSGGRSMVRRILLACGIFSSLLYVAMNVFLPMWWEGYSSASRVGPRPAAIAPSGSWEG